jgi:hypothetical protein
MEGHKTGGLIEQFLAQFQGLIVRAITILGLFAALVGLFQYAVH